MASLFRDELHKQFGTWPLAYIPYGGADFGEIEAVAQMVGDGDDAGFYNAWNAFADRLVQQAEDALKCGHRQSAQALFLRASAFYSASYHPLYGDPVDSRLLAAFRKQTQALNSGFALFEPAVVPLRIPFQETSLPAYLTPAFGYEREVRPLLILTNGYDGTITDMYFASAVAALAGGFREFVIQKMGVAPEAAANLGGLDEKILGTFEGAIRGNRALKWKVVQRGFWVHGVNNLRDYFASAEQFTMDGRAEQIGCPTLLTMAEGDALGSSAPSFYDALRCQKTLLRFTAAEGAAGHCEMQNRSLLNQRVLDWLDEQCGCV